MKNLNYGVIGNCKSAALVSDKGSIDFCCLPDFDCQSVFGRLLDVEKGGEFSIEPIGRYKITQSYVTKTNILLTRFARGGDIFEVYDFMPRYRTNMGSYHCPPDIVRYFKYVSGAPKFVLNFNPKLNYAQFETKTEIISFGLKSTTTKNSRYESLYLYSDFELESILEKRAIVLKEDGFVQVSYNQKLSKPDVDSVYLCLEKTKVYWMDWLAKTNLPCNYRREIERSALVLKLLAYQETGAILAAVTTSLPETIGDIRNWDYRYCWIRDASMVISILTKLNHQNVVLRFINFILDVIPFKQEQIQIMYSIKGNKDLKEKQLDWLSGYEGSRPVRIGNAAYKQKQHDIYGVLMDVIYQDFLNYRNSVDTYEELWTVVRTLVRYVASNWSKPDRGIWEIRNEKKHFTFSKVLCWVAIDRAEKIARLLGRDEDAEDWSKLGARIKRDIFRKGWNEKLGCFTQVYGEDNLDAANLLMEHYGFISADDPKYVNTVKFTYEKLCVDGLMYRYRNDDDFGRPESSFSVCTLWMIKSLARTGQRKLAKKMFDKFLGYSNHVGLFSEDIDFKTKRLLGNFPQGYSHLAIIDTALELCEYD